MKLEKREITLNEKDSLTDMLCTQKNIVQAYLLALENTQRKADRETLMHLLQEACEDVCFVGDLQKTLD